jgi:hypothetical protein
LLHPRIAIHSTPPHTSGICSDYNIFLEAVKAAKAREDERALGLLAKSEEAIEEVVSIFKNILPTGCSDSFLGRQAKAWGMTFVVACGTTSFYLRSTHR